MSPKKSRSSPFILLMEANAAQEHVAQTRHLSVPHERPTILVIYKRGGTVSGRTSSRACGGKLGSDPTDLYGVVPEFGGCHLHPSHPHVWACPDLPKEESAGGISLQITAH